MVVSSTKSAVYLPEIPIEQGWDLEEFLEQLCIKASLARDCWKWTITDIYHFTTYHY